jgi:hypothetical protein
MQIWQTACIFLRTRLKRNITVCPFEAMKSDCQVLKQVCHQGLRIEMLSISSVGIRDYRSYRQLFKDEQFFYVDISNIDQNFQYHLPEYDDSLSFLRLNAGHDNDFYYEDLDFFKDEYVRESSLEIREDDIFLYCEYYEWDRLKFKFVFDRFSDKLKYISITKLLSNKVMEISDFLNIHKIFPKILA